MCGRETAEEVSSKMLSWHVNAAAEIAGSVIFRDSDYIAKTKALIKPNVPFANGTGTMPRGASCEK